MEIIDVSMVEPLDELRNFVFVATSEELEVTHMERLALMQSENDFQ